MINDLEKNNSTHDDEISLKDLILKIGEWWRYVWSKKWIVILAGIIGGSLGLAYSFKKRPIYTATTTFVLESGEKSSGLGAYAGVASMMGIDLGSGGGIFQGDNILELYKSRTMLEKALLSPAATLEKQPLIERYIEFNGLRKDWEDKPELKNLQYKIGESTKDIVDTKQRRLKDSVISKIVEDITKTGLGVAKPDKKLSIIKVDVKSKDEFFAKRFNEELVRNVNDFYIQTKTKKSLDNVNILLEKADSVRRVMNGAIYSAAKVADATPNLNPTRQVQRTAPVQTAQFSAETNKAILAEMVKNLEMSRMALMKETPLIQVVDVPIYPLAKTKVSKMLMLILGASLASFVTSLYLYSRRPKV